MIRKLVTKTQFGLVLTALVVLTALFQNANAQQGGLDTTFGTNGTGIYQDALPSISDPVNIGRSYGLIEVLADGKIVVAGSAYTDGGGGNVVGDFVVRRLNADGSPDSSFGTNGTTQTTFYRYGLGVGQQSFSAGNAMKVQPADGKIIVAGTCIGMGVRNPNDTGLGSDICMVRYNANGTLDTSFGGNTLVAYGGNPNFPGTSYTFDAGKVFTFTGIDTTNNSTFGRSGVPVKVQVAPDGRIYVFGNSRDDGIGRRKGFVAVYSPNGTLQGITSLVDTTGNSIDGYGVTRIYDGDILSNGDFIAVGDQQTLVSSNPPVFSPQRWKVFTGSSGGGFLESGVNTAGAARAITMLRSNKILVGGSTVNAFGVPTLVRYNGDLTVDTTFGTNGRVVYDGTTITPSIDTFYIASLKTQPDGKIIGTTNNGNIFRFNPNGSPDRSFARDREDVADSLSRRGVLSNGRYITPFPTRPGQDARINFGGVSFQSNGKLVTSGCVGCDIFSRAVVTRLKTSFRNGGTFSDFNNDGKSEISVFRPSNGAWYQLESFGSQFSAVQFGSQGDKLAPADFDGDGRTDTAVFRGGTWYILQSSNNQIRTVQWGIAEDLPRPGDFNGDGQADIAVFRPSNGTWYVLYSNPVQPGNVTVAIVQFGANGDAPLIADFDGDGKSDYAVYRGGNWYWIRSTNGSVGILQWGISTDIPVTGDYDADGKTDWAVFRNGNWYVLRSSDFGFSAVQWGAAGDRPTPGDFDNDGKHDYAVFRSGTWFILRSSDNGFSSTPFGSAGDVPIQTAYLP